MVSLAPWPPSIMPKPKPAPIVSTGYWLFKSEPDAFSWDMLVAKGAAGEPCLLYTSPSPRD